MQKPSDSTAQEAMQKDMDKFIAWSTHKVMLYGQPYLEWWDNIGRQSFIKFAQEKYELTYLDEQSENPNA